MKTHITVILDRSMSMSMCKEGTITGYNEFLRKQKAEPGEATFTLVQFDHEYKVSYDGTLGLAPELTYETFQPRGNTALNDAQGKAITELGAKLAATKKEDRPDNVIIVIMTDGGENASREYTHKQVAELIKHQQEKYSWSFLFIGANQDAVQIGSTYNISKGSSLTYNVGAAAATMGVASNFVRSARTGSTRSLTEKERNTALGK